MEGRWVACHGSEECDTVDLQEVEGVEDEEDDDFDFKAALALESDEEDPLLLLEGFLSDDFIMNEDAVGVESNSSEKIKGFD